MSSFFVFREIHVLKDDMTLVIIFHRYTVLLSSLNISVLFDP